MVYEFPESCLGEANLEDIYRVCYQGILFSRPCRPIRVTSAGMIAPNEPAARSRMLFRMSADAYVLDCADLAAVRRV